MMRWTQALRSNGITAALLLSVSMAGAQNVAARADYTAVAALLRTEIQHEVTDKKLPSFAIALVDDQTTVWAEGFGFEDAAMTAPATAHTVFRVGSVSKLFTDIAVMQLAARGKLDLDAPVNRYLSQFAPKNPYGKEITLRELMSHRAGLLREPPVGHYFDSTSPSLQATVASLNKTALVSPPGTQTKYSNAGVATVGYVLDQVMQQPFAAYIQQSVLDPLNMHESAFTPEPALTEHLANARMWSYSGLDFAAPTFQLGEISAGSMYSTAADLGLFLSALFKGDREGTAALLPTETLHEMWKPQLGGRFGLGFALSSLDGHREIGHSGAIYGFAAQLDALPDDKFGVIAITTLDGANAVTQHIADDALRLMLASRAHTALTVSPPAQKIDSSEARKAAGRYMGVNGSVTLHEQNGLLSLSRDSGGPLVELKSMQGHFIEDSPIAYSTTPITVIGDSLRIGDQEYNRLSLGAASQVRKEWRELIGEYGWDYDKLYVLEDSGKLKILVEWFDFEPMKQLSSDKFLLPPRGLYSSEKVAFLRNAAGQIRGLTVGSVFFPLRPSVPPGQVFKITPLKPVPELRREALALKPPVESGNFLKPDLVELTSIDPSIKLDIRYATSRDFLGAPMYLQPRAFMQRPAAQAVARASQYLHSLGYGLMIHDSYRPWYVTKMFWDGTPDDKKIFVANPSEGSRHNRGCAVDLTLYDLKTGKAVEMTGGYDEMSERSYPFYPGGTSIQRWHRDVLRHAMEHEGFTVYEYEWWHFDYNDWKRYPILNLTFEELDRESHSHARE